MDLWIKAVHVIAVIAWMAGLLYLPRLFVYHADAKPGSELSETLEVMEARLLRIIMTPALAVVWVTGPLLAWRQGMIGDHWLWAKFALVVGLSWFHGQLGGWQRAFTAGRNERPARFYRLVNEAPALVMAVIVVLVIVKPF